jgi:hypothetical protein
MAETNQAWWESLNHGGLLIGPKQLATFPETAPKLSDWTVEQLRRHLNRFDAAKRVDERRAVLVDLLNVVLENVCGLGEADGTWRKDPGSEWSRILVTGEHYKPRRVWTHLSGTAFPVFLSDDERLGIGRGVRSVSRVLEWLRKGSERIALLTNGRQWRLIYAGLDHEAWAQWDTEQWFAEGVPGPQVTALQILLSPEAVLPKKSGELSPLLAAIDETRKGQAEVSAELGERVRKAVELLIQAHATALDEKGGELARKDVYLAAVRMVMRMVVILFAEARDLLPRDNALYFGSYGLQGLREILRRAAGGRRERLRNRSGAWPRVLALFRLVYDGSPHRAMPVPRYGGDLFRPGIADGDDGIRRAVHLFESAAFQHEVSDDVVYEMLELITTTHVRVRQGNAARVARVPVNFADLSTEYIGMLYEGLLGYELRRVSDDDEAIIFLNLGDQPALPLKRLEEMNDKTLENLVDKFKKKVAAVAVSEDEGEDAEEEQDDAEAAGEEGAEETVEADEEVAEPLTEADNRQVIRERAVNWAKRAVIAGKLVSRPRAARGNAEAEYQLKVSEKAKQITGTAYLPGQYFLIRSSGTRKGSGTFYTRPALAIPTTHRTLRALAYVPPVGQDGRPNELAPLQEWTPRTPEEILALKVCDPACGSASFLVAALRFLTDALYVSLHQHGRIQPKGDSALIMLAEGKEGAGVLAEETLPCRPDAEQFEARLKARLKRYVVERCIYGVDYDRLAIELARMALWIETMDRELPFEFLDHKVKHGNALVGAWFDTFQHYPVMALKNRDAGDKKHSNAVHFEQGSYTEALKKRLTEVIGPDLARFLAGATLFTKDQQKEALALHAESVASIQRIHELPIQDVEERAKLYRETILESGPWRRVKGAFDLWAAIWFWPADKADALPLASELASPRTETQSVAASVARHMSFFHWELEFPDVFVKELTGFDAILGNPPWETLQPSSLEFFTPIDPLYRSYGRTEADKRQKELFVVPTIEREWIDFNAGFAGYGQWMKYISNPWGDPTVAETAADRFTLVRGGKNLDLHDNWRHVRSQTTGYVAVPHPYVYQGSGKAYTYKMFLELSHALTRDDGRFGMIVPSGIYTDKGTTELRQLFLDECRWRWLFGFENSRKIFDIHRSYKFNAVIVEKGGSTEAILTAFMRRDLRDWEEGEKYAIEYTRAQVERFSPKTKAILEIRDRRDLGILEKIYSNSVLLGDQGEHGWGIKYAQGDFNMTTDAKLFPPRPWWEESGYHPDKYGRWIAPNGDVALPLYEGRMIGQFDLTQKGWISGKGRGAVWRTIPVANKVMEPQYLMAESVFVENQPNRPESKVAHMRIGSATNERSTIAAVVGAVPTGDTAAVLWTGNLERDLALSAILNSLTFDSLMRRRLGGLHLDYHVFEQMPLPRLNDGIAKILAGCAAQLTFVGGPSELLRKKFVRETGEDPPEVIDPRERRRLRAMVDAVVAWAYGLSVKDLRYLLRDCMHSCEDLRKRSIVSILDPKGFWRVDSDLDPESRATNLAVDGLASLYEAVSFAGSDIDGVALFQQRWSSDAERTSLPDSSRSSDRNSV